MLVAKNRLTLPDHYIREGTFEFDPNNPKQKVTIIVKIPTGDPVNSAVMQVSPNSPAAFDALPVESTEIELEPGFHSRAFDFLIYGVRFRGWNANKNTIITFTIQ